MTPEELQRAQEAEAKQRRDANGRFTTTDGGDDTTDADAEPTTSAGLDQGVRGATGKPARMDSEAMSDSLRGRLANMRGL